MEGVLVHFQRWGGGGWLVKGQRLLRGRVGVKEKREKRDYLFNPLP